MKLKQVKAYQEILPEEADFCITYIESGFPNTFIMIYEDPYGELEAKWVKDNKELEMCIGNFKREVTP